MAQQEVKLRITTDASGAITGIRKASDELKRLESASGSVTGMIRQHWAGIASAITVSGIAALGRGALETMEQIDNLSQRVGMSAESLQVYQYAAKLADVENETLSKGLMKLSKNMYDAASGSQEMSSNFQKLGLSATDNAGQLRTTDVMLEGIAERFSHMKDGTEKTALAMKLFGKSGAELIPLLNEGSKGLNRMGEEAKKLGIVFSAEDAARAEEFNDNIERIEVTFKGVATKVMGEVLPALLNVSESFIKNIKDGDGLRQTVEGLGTAFKALVSFGMGVVAAFDIIGTALAGIAVKAENFVTAIRESKDIILSPGIGWSGKAAMLKESWSKGIADIGLGADLEAKLQSYGSMIEAVWEKKGKSVKPPGPPSGGKPGIDTAGLAEISRIIDKMGGADLKLASDDFHRKLARQTEDVRQFTVAYHDLSDTVRPGLELERQVAKVDDLTAAFEDYGRIVDQVYGRQMEMQRDLTAELVNCGLKQADVSKQAAGITETEVRHNEARLASYRSYYDELKKMQKGFYDVAVKSANDMAKIEKDMVAGSNQTARLQQAIRSRAVPAGNELEQYYNATAQLDQELTQAMAQSGEERVRVLGDIQRRYAELAKEINVTETQRQLVIGSNWGSSDFQDVAVTKTVRTFEEVYQRVAGIGEAIRQTQEQMWVEASSTRDRAIAAYEGLIQPLREVEGSIIGVQYTIADLDNLLASQRTLTVDVSGALSGLNMVIDRMNTINSISTTRVSGYSHVGRSIVDTGSSEGVWEANAAEVYGSYASGTDYVPRTGLYRLHQGEKVVPASQNVNNSRSVSVTFGDIVIQGGTEKDARQLARQLAPAIRSELRKINFIQ